MTKEESLSKTNPHFTMKDIRRFVRENEEDLKFILAKTKILEE